MKLASRVFMEPLVPCDLDLCHEPEEFRGDTGGIGPECLNRWLVWLI